MRLHFKQIIQEPAALEDLNNIDLNIKIETLKDRKSDVDFTSYVVKRIKY